MLSCDGPLSDGSFVAKLVQHNHEMANLFKILGGCPKKHVNTQT